MTGVESPPAQNFAVTKEGKSIFSTPNEIVPGKIFVDDAWVDWDRRDKVFATTENKKELVVGARQHGKGLYIITSLRNDSQYTTAINKALMENIMHYAASQLK